MGLRVIIWGILMHVHFYPRYQVWGVMELGFDFAFYHPPLGFHLIYTNMGDANMSAHLCFSYVGRTDPDGPGKGQVVNLGSAECLTIGKILHETLHSLGQKPNF